MFHAADDFTATSRGYAARLDVATEETLTYMNGETAALAKEITDMICEVIDNPARARKNLTDLVDVYPGGAVGLAGAALSVLAALAAKRKAKKSGKSPVTPVPDYRLEDDGSHQCTHPACTNTVAYDDEPYCFTHSPDSGSTRPGYSYAATQRSLSLLDEV